VLDLDSHTFAGASIGDPIDRLSFLGPAQGWSLDLEFPDRGLAIGTGGQRVDELMFFFGHPEELRGGRFTGHIVFRGEPLCLRSSDDEHTLVARFGEPYWRDTGSDESILFYEFGTSEWQLELAADGGLKCLVIARPLLADPQQRLAYGVNKPWPPVQFPR
jgi:hypothetical protein